MTSRLTIIYADGRVCVRDVTTQDEELCLCVQHMHTFEDSSFSWCLTFGDIILHVINVIERPPMAMVLADWTAKAYISALYIDGIQVFSAPTKGVLPTKR